MDETGVLGLPSPPSCAFVQGVGSIFFLIPQTVCQWDSCIQFTVLYFCYQTSIVDNQS